MSDVEHARPDVTAWWVTLAEALRAAREAKGWTQQDLADALGIPQTQVSRFERGSSGRPPYDLTVRYGRLVGLSPNQLAEIAGWWA